MTRAQQAKRAYALDESLRKKVAVQKLWEDDLDEQIEAALKRIELRTPGLDGPKWLAEEITDDPAHPVSASTVYDMLGRRAGRRPCAEIIAALYRADAEFAAWWNTTLGYEVPQRHCPLSVEQQNALLRLKLKEFGAEGERKIAQVDAARSDGAP